MFEIFVYNRILNIVQILSNLRIKSKILSEVRTKLDMLEKNSPLRLHKEEEILKKNKRNEMGSKTRLRYHLDSAK